MSLEFLSIEHIQQFAHNYGYWAIFWGILLENFGLPIPGETVTLVGGFLAGSHELSYWLVLANAIAGASIGGICGYGIGRLGGWSLLVRVSRLFRISETRLILIKDQFSKNAAKAVFFGRFLALLRVFCAPLAGIVQMPFPKFLSYNLAGAAIWGTVMVSLSFFAGTIVSLEQLIAWVGQFAIIALLIVVALIVVPLWLEMRANKEQTKG